MSHQDQPLTETFLENPLQYMQNHVRNLNNQIFLSEYHINSLYALLLIGRNSPWDMVKSNSPAIKEQIDHILNQKVYDVKSILENLSNMYEDKSKKSAITQIEKLMNILKSKKKSIFIQKDRDSNSFRRFQALSRMAHQMQKQDKQKEDKEPEEKATEAENVNASSNEGKQKEEENMVFIRQYEEENPNKQVEQTLEKIELSRDEPSIKAEQIVVEKKTNQNTEKSESEQKVSEEKQICQHCSKEMEAVQSQKEGEEKVRPNLSSGKQVFSIFYGLSNMSNLTAMALTNIVEHNSVQRYIKFKMSQTYIMTIKSQDPFNFDTQSSLSKLPPEMFTNHIFPYLTASQLFQARGVCKEWLDHVKESWHATFKRQMFIQLLACQFCKDIEFYYKTIQLRNPFFQKISLLIHALIQIINWQSVRNLIHSNTMPLQLKRIFMILLRLIAQPIPFTTLNSITDQFFEQHKNKLDNIKDKVSSFFSSLSGSDLSINDLRVLKTNYLDDPFMRVDDVNADDKTPLLVNLLVKQITLQQILRSHIYLAQEYLLNTKRRLDNISKKMVYHKGYLQGVYKILLLKSTEPLTADSDSNEPPNFNDMLQSIFTNNSCDKPDFVLKSKSSLTQIYLDKATKLDIILSTVYNINQGNVEPTEHKQISTFTENQGAFVEASTVEEKTEKALKNQIVNSVNLKIETGSGQKIQIKEKVQNGQQTEEKLQITEGKTKILPGIYSQNNLGQARKEEPK